MLRDIPSSALKQLVKLSERKEALMAQIQEIDREMARVQGKFGVPNGTGKNVRGIKKIGVAKYRLSA